MKFPIFLPRTAKPFFGLTVLFVSINAASAFAEARLYVLDNKEDSITAISREGESLWEVQLEGSLDRMAISPNGGHLIALDKGRGKKSNTHGWTPRSRSSISVIATNSQELTHLSEVCWSASVGVVERGIGLGGAWYFSPDGKRLVILCEGRWASVSGDTVTRKTNPDYPELLEIDLDSRAVVSRVSVKRRVTGWTNLPDGRSFAIFLPAEQNKANAELRFIDGQTLEVEYVLQLEADTSPALMSADQDLLYLLDWGKPTKKEKTNVHGTLYVVSIAARQLVGKTDVGTAPRVLFDVENSQLIFASDLGPNSSGKKSDTGIIRIIKGAELVDTFEVGREPVYVQSFPGVDRLYTVGKRTFTVTDTSSGVSREVEYPKKMRIFGEMVVTSDHTRAFLLAAQTKQRGFDLNVIDLENQTMAKPLPVGSRGKFWGKGLAFGALAVGASSAVTSMMPSGNPMWIFRAEDLVLLASDIALSAVIQDAIMQGIAGGASSSISFGPEERYVYAINDVTKDVTVFDAKNLDRGTVVPDSDGARLLRLLPESNRLAVLARDEGLMMVDTASQTIVEERDFGGNFMFIGDSGDAIALSRKTQSVYLLSGAQLQVIRSASSIKNPYQFVLTPN